jgi:uncharacterized protein YgiM (DUF1202 family)
MKRSRSILLVAALLAPSLLHAETVYVIDKLLVGVHSGKTLDSPIIKVFPTGTQLEVLKRDGDLAKVKGPGDVTGWVDASYLTKNQPASVVLDMIETQNRDLVNNLKQAKAKIADLEAQVAKAPAGDGKSDLDRLQKENASLQAALKAEQSKAKDLQSKLNAAPPSGQASDESGILAQLRHENAALKQALADAQQEPSTDSQTPEQTSTNTVASSLAATAALGKRTLQHLGAWAVSPLAAVIVFAVLLLTSFLGGIALTDYIHRKRHGGFRV